MIEQGEGVNLRVLLYPRGGGGPWARGEICNLIRGASPCRPPLLLPPTFYVESFDWCTVKRRCCARLLIGWGGQGGEAIEHSPHDSAHAECEGVFITQRNNSAVVGFTRSYSHNGKWRFLKSLPGVLHKFFTIDRYYLVIQRIKIWGKSDDQILRNRGSKFEVCPPISQKRGAVGGQNFYPQ